MGRMERTRIRMRLLRILGPALMALLMLGVATAPVAAQDVDPAEGTDFQDLEGIQKAYVRSYSVDFMAMMESATPDAEPSGWFVLTIMALEFDSEDNASSSHDVLLQDLETTDMGDAGATFEDAELDVDFDHTAKLAVMEEEGMTSTMLLATAQDGNHIYIVIGLTFGEDPGVAAGSLLTSMKETDISDDEEMFSVDGTSMGGLWAKLPSVDQVREEAPSLTQATDAVAYPVTEGTPAG